MTLVSGLWIRTGGKRSRMAPSSTQTKLCICIIFVYMLKIGGGPQSSLASPIERHSGVCVDHSISELISLMHANTSCSGPVLNITVSSKEVDLVLTACDDGNLGKTVPNTRPCNLGKFSQNLCSNYKKNATTRLAKDKSCRSNLQSLCDSLAISHLENNSSGVNYGETLPLEASGQTALCSIVNTMCLLFNARDKYLKSLNSNHEISPDSTENMIGSDPDSADQKVLNGETVAAVAQNENKTVTSKPLVQNTWTVRAGPSGSTSAPSGESRNASVQPISMESNFSSTQAPKKEAKTSTMDVSSNTKSANENIELPNGSNSMSKPKPMIPPAEASEGSKPVSTSEHENVEHPEVGNTDLQANAPTSSQAESLRGNSQQTDPSPRSKVDDTLGDKNEKVDNEDMTPSEEKEPPRYDYDGDEKRDETGVLPENDNANSDVGRKESAPVQSQQSEVNAADGVTFLDRSEDESESGYIGYFISLIGFLGICFLLLHNKKRILAFVIEGRKPTSGRRRSTTSYRKLENNFD